MVHYYYVLNILNTNQTCEGVVQEDNPYTSMETLNRLKDAILEANGLPKYCTNDCIFTTLTRL